MRRLSRLAAVVVLAAALVAATATSVAALTGRLLAGATSSTSDPLPALDTSVLTGTTILADDAKTVIGTFSGPEVRRPVDLSAISKTLITAVLDTEDQRFYLHGGFDIPSTVRALASDTSGAGLQGGSTITQQLVKQIYLSPARTLNRKVKEAVLAARLNQKYSKDQILKAYLNIIYLGDSAYGIEAAANIYFGEHASQLDLPQSALLAGLIQNPTGYDPRTNPEAARTRRSQVLGRMVHYHDITQAQADAANATPLPDPQAASTETITVTNPVYDDYVSEVYNELIGPTSPLGSDEAQRKAALDEGGLRIVTGLDIRIQDHTVADVANDVPRSATAACPATTLGCGYQEGAVVIDATTGGVRAMVGGDGETATTTPTPGFSVMTDGLRQPGSGFKLFTLVAALEAGYSPYSQVSAVAPCAISFPGQYGFLETPAQNDQGDSGSAIGNVDILTATAQSLNCAFVRIGHEVTLPAVASWAAKLGITTPLADPKSGLLPSMILGGIEVKPIDMAAAYATIADGGVYHRPTFVDRIIDPSGATAATLLDKGHQVVSAQVAAEATLCLRAVVTEGTGTSAALYDRPVAGKTGTTSGPTDAWFNGFTPSIESTVWMGAPSGNKHLVVFGQGVYGASYPAHTWHDVMADAVATSPVLQFAAPVSSLMPAAKPVYSRALISDDKSRYIVGDCTRRGSTPPTCHVPVAEYGLPGSGPYVGPSSGNYGNYGGSGSGYGSGSGTTTTVPGRSPVTAPKRTVPTTTAPVATAPPASPPATTGGTP